MRRTSLISSFIFLFVPFELIPGLALLYLHSHILYSSSESSSSPCVTKSISTTITSSLYLFFIHTRFNIDCWPGWLDDTMRGWLGQLICALHKHNLGVNKI